MLNRLNRSGANFHVCWIISGLIVSCFVRATAAATLNDVESMTTVAQLANVVSTEPNAVVRAEAVKRLGHVASKDSSSGAAAVRALLILAMADQNITVCREAIRQVGMLRLAALADSLVAMYGSAMERWGSRQTEVRVLLLEALGRTRSPQACTLFVNVLAAAAADEVTLASVRGAVRAADTSMLAPLAQYRDTVQAIIISVKDTVAEVSKLRAYRNALVVATNATNALQKLQISGE